MKKELCFMSDLLDDEGIGYEDELILTPFSGKKRFIKLNRLKFNFTTSKSQMSKPWIIEIDSIQKEELNFEIRLNETVGRNGKFFKRYLVQSLNQIPFKLNGSLVYEAFIEHRDICEFGYHQIEFRRKDKEQTKKSLFNDLDLDLNLIRSKIPILIEGDTGVGKSYVAKKIHEASRATGNFVHVNLCSFSPSLIESELFGHAKGSFTGAINDKVGALRQARGGTLFLDEIDSLNIEMQTKLLLFLEDFYVRPVGSSSKYFVDTRIVCASGQSLEGLVIKGLMRKDFFFRISSGKKIMIKPLNQSHQSIHNIINSIATKNGVYFTPQLITYYKKLSWPGNIRQLKGHLDKKIALTGCEKINYCKIDDELLKADAFFKSEICTKTVTLGQLKRDYSLKVFYQFNQNLTMAAKNLDISIKTLKRLLEPC